MTNLPSKQGNWFTTIIISTAVVALGAGAYGVGVTGVLTAAPGQLFQPIALSVIVPVALFVAVYLLAARFRRFILSRDLRTLTMLQHWRIMGFAFLPLYAFDILPGLFAIPAGVGDIAIGLAAPFVVARLTRDPEFARGWRFVAFHVAGMVDFVVAVGTSVLVSGAFPALVSGNLTSAPMEVWPLNIFPSFAVPIFIILHLMVFLKINALRKERLLPANQSSQTA